MSRYRSRRSDSFSSKAVALVFVSAFAATTYVANWFDGEPVSDEPYTVIEDQAFGAQTTAELAAIESSVYYAGCNEVRAQGKAPLYRGDPGYGAHMDGDGDGIACEPYY